MVPSPPKSLLPKYLVCGIRIKVLKAAMNDETEKGLCERERVAITLLDKRRACWLEAFVMSVMISRSPWLLGWTLDPQCLEKESASFMFFVLFWVKASWHGLVSWYQVFLISYNVRQLWHECQLPSGQTEWVTDWKCCLSVPMEYPGDHPWQGCRSSTAIQWPGFLLHKILALSSQWV